MNKPYPLRIPEKMIELAEAKAREERTDRATALRGLIYAGAEDYVVGLLAQARISASRAAELLDVSVHRIHHLARERGVPPGSAVEEHERGLETVRKLLN
jgi:predicted HTH domain antitoxin